MVSENRVKLCFDILKNYRHNIKKSILRQGISIDETENIIKNFKLDNDIIFSMNKEYQKGTTFLDFCIENNISTEIPDMINFHHSLYKHQENAIKSIMDGKCTIVSTGTGSGKTESFLIPILDYCIKNRGKKGVKAIIIYPMNALAGDQLRRIKESVKGSDITYAMINGDTPNKKQSCELEEECVLSREEIIELEPDILVTNYVMLERMLTNPRYYKLFNNNCNIFKYIVLDEIHTYNGNKALHIKFLLHRLRAYLQSNNIVQIGCSATLSRNKDGQKTDGYIDGEVDEFITDMFNIKSKKNYSYIEPVYEKLENLSYDVDDSSYRELNESIITKRIKRTLYEGSRSLSEIKDILNEDSNNTGIDEESIIKYFEKVLNLNEKYPQKPILDFRIHMFLLKIGDKLRRCAKCGRYYTMKINKCNDCGNIVLPVYANDTNLLVGELKDGIIKEADTNESEILNFNADEYLDNVLLNFNKNIQYKCNPFEYEHILNFNTYITKEDGIVLDIEKSGVYQVLKKKNGNYRTIQFTSDYDFDYKIIKYNLKELENKNKKILGFIDNREKCGRYSTVFSDEFLSDFYLNVMKYAADSGNKNTIEYLYKKCSDILNEEIPHCANISNEFKKIVIDEFGLWFRRYIIDESISIEINKEKRGKRFYINQKLSDDEDFVAAVAMKEAVYFENNITKAGKRIRLRRLSFMYSKGMGFTASKGKNIISLSSNGIKYRDYIKIIGQSRLKKAVEGLIAKGILVERIIDRENTDKESEINFPNSVFYLNSDKVIINIDKSNYDSFENLINENLYFAGVHTSEVPSNIRNLNEDKFQNGEINFLAATPTLEMGIDIGNLSFVYMLGVPPVPSNYAQRAGRAGRRGDRFAGIITVCSEFSSHDWYYFNNPKEIIEGLINPPKFDIYNKKVLNKHVNTIIYKYWIKGITYDNMVYLENLSEDIFDCPVDIEEQIALLENRIENLDNKRMTMNELYENGVFPEYGFSRDVVKIYDETESKKYKSKYGKKYDKTKSDSYKNDYIKKDDKLIVATRELEMGYKLINIDRSMFIGNKYYYIAPVDYCKSFKSMNDKKVIDIKELSSINNEQHIEKKKDVIKKEHYINIELDKSRYIRESKGPISYYLKNDMKMEFIAEYKKEDFSDKNRYYGYKLCKDSIVFEFDKNEVAEIQYVSFMALLHKVILMEFGLDNSELALVADDKVNINGQDNPNENKAYCILYDKSGNKNIDMERILESLMDEKNILENAYNLISNCNCTKSTGCYLCMKSFETQWLYEKLHKYKGRNLVGYLLGREKLQTSLTLRQQVINYEAEMSLKERNNLILTINNEEKILENKESYNETIMYGLYKEIRNMYEKEDIETVKFTSKIRFIITGINEETKIKNTNGYLELFNFYKQAFKKFDAVLIEKK